MASVMKPNVSTLKASVETCIARDAGREKVYGEDTARVIHLFVSRFDKGVVIDTDEKSLAEIVLKVLASLPASAENRIEI